MHENKCQIGGIIRSKGRPYLCPTGTQVVQSPTHAFGHRDVKEQQRAIQRLPHCQLFKIRPECPFLCKPTTWESSLLFLFPPPESTRWVRNKHQGLKALAAVVDKGAACLPLPQLLPRFPSHVFAQTVRKNS